MTETSPSALSIRGLSKSFGSKVSVDRIDLEVPRGSFFGLVGPNGAGKTTLLSMAVGLLRPDAGTATVLGADVWREGLWAKSMLGVLPDDLAMPEFLTGREVLTFLGRLRGLDPDLVDSRAQDLLDVMGLLEAEQTLVVDYSTGMRKKIGLAAALLHNPKVLVLDEPFEAVDPVSAATLKRILTQFVGLGGSVVFSSHVMALVEHLCDTVAIMSDAVVVATGPTEELRGEATLEETFVSLVVTETGLVKELSWLGT